MLKTTTNEGARVASEYVGMFSPAYFTCCLVIGVFFCVSYFLVRTAHFIVLSWGYSTSNVFSYGTGNPNTLSAIKINVLLLTCLLLSIFDNNNNNNNTFIRLVHTLIKFKKNKLYFLLPLQYFYCTVCTFNTDIYLIIFFLLRFNNHEVCFREVN